MERAEVIQRRMKETQYAQYTQGPLWEHGAWVIQWHYQLLRLCGVETCEYITAICELECIQGEKLWAISGHYPGIRHAELRTIKKTLS
jgi:hypothetical protein